MSCLKYHFIIFIINVFFDRLGSGGHGQCNHVGGILFAIEDFNRQGLQNRSEPVTCTSRLCTWNVPRNSKVAAKPVDDINIVKYRYGKDNRTSVKSSVYDPRAPCDRVLNKAKLNSMLVKLSQHLPSSSLFLFHDIKPSLDSQNVIVDSTCECVPLNCIEMVELTSEHDDMDLPFNDDYDIATKKFKSMIDIYEERITDNDVERIERLSRGQDNTFWRELKQEKLTASNFKAAAKRRVEPDKLLKQIMYKIEETTNVSALQYGHMHEDNAINDYIKYKHSQGNTGLTVWKVGTYISKIRPGLGASLDRMVYDPLAHCKKGGLEIKCPYSKQGMTIGLIRIPGRPWASARCRGSCGGICDFNMAFVGGAESEVQKWKVPELKSYLQSRGITVSQKRKEELVELVEKARDLSLEPIDDWEKPEDVIVNKLQTKEGSLPCPNTLHSDWTSDFSDFPNFTYGDMYAYLINKEGYDHESLKAYKSFEGYRLFWDGHVLKLMKNKNLFNGYHYVKFGVKPTEREKTQVGQKPTYDGWIIIQSDGSVYTAHCPCIGGCVFCCLG